MPQTTKSNTSRSRQPEWLCSVSIREFESIINDLPEKILFTDKSTKCLRKKYYQVSTTSPRKQEQGELLLTRSRRTQFL